LRGQFPFHESAFDCVESNIAAQSDHQFWPIADRSEAQILPNNTAPLGHFIQLIRDSEKLSKSPDCTNVILRGGFVAASPLALRKNLAIRSARPRHSPLEKLVRPPA